jgi:hypothetical protein
MTQIGERRRLACTFGASAETIFFSPEDAEVARNTGILPVSSNGHPAWSRPSRLGSLHDLSGWKPKLL